MLASRSVSFYETIIEASSWLCIRFLSNLCKNDLNTVLVKNLFSIANDCSVNLSDLSKMLVKKQMKYFDVPFWTMDGNMYVMSNDPCRLFVILHFFSFFSVVKLYIQKFI